MELHCLRCGGRLEERLAFGRLRGVCPRCGHTHFEDPKVAVGMVLELDGRLVLCQRGIEPKRGLWSFPSGFVESGEVLEDAIRREVLEETGLVASVDALLGAYSSPGERVVFICYAGTVTGGELTTGDECLDVQAFDEIGMPPLAFDHDFDIIDAWQKYWATRA